MLIIKLLFLLSVLLPQSDGWQRIETDQGISFLFPNRAQHLKKETNGVISDIYQTKDLACVLGVVCSDFSNQQIELNRENTLALYEQLKNGSVDMETAILKNERTVPYENMLIKEIEYSIIKDKYEMTYFKRFIFRDNIVYQITIGGRTRLLDILQKEREIFFNSVYFPFPENQDTDHSNR